MKKTYFTGQCPQCSLYGQEHLMRENDTQWECPQCRLQIVVENNHATIFRHRGHGHLKLNFNRHSGNITFQEVDEISYPNGVEILRERQLIAYLMLKVDQQPKYSLEKLIDTYIDFKFGGCPADLYLEQSFHFSIDFDNVGIVEVLESRDTRTNVSNQYSTKRLYYFLISKIFPKYHAADNSFLPEMGMNLVEMYLYRKHFPEWERGLINSSPLYIKQRLKELAVDLIEIIYNNNHVLLSFDPQELLKILQHKFKYSLN